MAKMIARWVGHSARRTKKRVWTLERRERLPLYTCLGCDTSTRASIDGYGKKEKVKKKNKKNKNKNKNKKEEEEEENRGLRMRWKKQRLGKAFSEETNVKAEFLSLSESCETAEKPNYEPCCSARLSY
ncbi:hypothetical protein ACLOJK_009772 [Asimina triloba]